MRPSGSGASRFNDLTGGPGIARQEQYKTKYCDSGSDLLQ